MRAVIHRVKSANVKVEGKVVSEIKEGLCALIGLCQEDTESDLEFIVKKILDTPVFQSQNTLKSLAHENRDILCISQFTLYGKTVKGNKPDFHESMKTENARKMYNIFLDKLRTAYKREMVYDGVFGAMMDVSMQTDGILTLQFDSKKFEYL
ncbi:hypothetical protein BB561_002027 [Smittium simulii]|uniref:D-aminoacyl-tRNA deacylase n=1 Tax=Smittium simulii TaxID=133385 RepID=A0A2T9YS45_9FUNG|nr:hypothetical protein BB561_002027 [Smittium simulii]